MEPLKTTDLIRTHEMNREKTIEVCPVCGTSDFYYEAGGYTGKIYHCKNCDYVGALIVEADEEMAKAIRDEYQKKGKRDEQA